MDILILGRDSVFNGRIKIMKLRENRCVGDGHPIKNKFLAGIELIQCVEMDVPFRFSFFSRVGRLGAANRVIGVDQHFIGPIFER